MKKKLFICLLIFVLVCSSFAFVACKKDEQQQDVPPQQQDVPQGEAVLRIMTPTLSMDLYDTTNIYVWKENITERISWTSSNSEVVTVYNQGTVAAVGVGTATVTATANGKTTSCLVTVYDSQMSASIVLSTDMVSLSKNGEFAVSASAFWKGEESTGATLTWTVLQGESDQIVNCTPSTDGHNVMFTGKSFGQTKYVVSTTIQGQFVAKTLDICCVDTSVVFNIFNMVGADGYFCGSVSLFNHGSDTTTIKPDISIYQNNVKVAQPTLTWTVDDDSIATVSPDGTITSVSEGSTFVTCKYQDSICKILVQVYRPRIAMPTQIIISKALGSYTFSDTFDSAITDVVIANKSVMASCNGNAVTFDNAKMPKSQGEMGEKELIVDTSTSRYVYNAFVCDYAISTADELDKLQEVADAVDGTVGDDKFGGYIILSNDIDYTGHAYPAYKVNGNYYDWSANINGGFSGLFDGRGYNIDNFTFDVAPEGRFGSGLFNGFIGGTICNVSFTNAIHNGYGFITNYYSGGKVENTFIHIKHMASRPSDWTNACGVFGIGGNTMAGVTLTNNIVVIDNYDKMENSNKYSYGLGLFTLDYLTLNNTYIVGGSQTDAYNFNGYKRITKSHYSSCNDLPTNIAAFNNDFWYCGGEMPIPANLVDKMGINSISILTGSLVSSDSSVALKASTSFVKYTLGQDAIALGITIANGAIVIPQDILDGSSFTVTASLAYDSSISYSKTFNVGLTYSTMNPLVSAFMNDGIDSIEQYETEYKIDAIDYSRPQAIRLSWNCDDYDSYTVHVSESDTFATELTYQTAEKFVDLYNVKVGTKYYWKVTASQGENSYQSQVEEFVTQANAPRLIYVDGATNVRDLGGWLTSDTTRIKQGLIYRSAQLDKLTDAGKNTLLNELGIKTEIDLRRPEDGATHSEGLGNGYIGSSVYYYKCSMDWDFISSANDSSLIKLFRILSDESNYPVVFHCTAGADRTGFVAYLIELLMGAQKNDVYHDYLITNFARQSERGRRIVSSYDTAIANYNGATLADKTYNYLVNVRGVKATHLDSIKFILQDDYDGSLYVTKPLLTFNYSVKVYVDGVDVSDDYTFTNTNAKAYSVVNYSTWATEHCPDGYSINNNLSSVKKRLTKDNDVVEIYYNRAIRLSDKQYVEMISAQALNDGINEFKSYYSANAELMHNVDVSAYTHTVTDLQVVEIPNIAGELSKLFYNGAEVDGATFANGQLTFPKSIFGTIKGDAELIANIVETQGKTSSIKMVVIPVYLCDFVIRTADDLDAMQFIAHKIANKDINEWNFNFDGYFVLANDIVYNATLDSSNGYNNSNNRWYRCYTQGWDAGYGAGGFSGTLEGNGHNIQGLVIRPSSSNQSYLQYYSGTGLFTCLKGKGNIRNLSFTHGVALGEGFVVGAVASNDGAYLQNVCVQLDYMEGEKGQGTSWLTANGAVTSWEGLGGNRWIDTVFVKIDNYTGNAYAIGRCGMTGSIYCVCDGEMYCYQTGDSSSTRVFCKDYSRHYDTYADYVASGKKLATGNVTFWNYMEATYGVAE